MPLTAKNRKLLLSLLLLIVFGLIGKHWWTIAHFAVNVPIGDEWEALRSPELLGQFNPTWIFAQHNEHRIIVTKLQTWLLYNWNHWDIRTQIFQNFAIYLFTIGVLVWILRKCSPTSLPAVLIGVIFLLSTRAYENHIWGFQSQFHFVMLFGFLACYWLIQAKVTWSRLLLGALFSLLTIFSFSSGVPMVVAIALVFTVFVLYGCLQMERPKTDLAKLLVYWGLVAAGLFSYFSFDYRKVSGHPQYSYPTDPQFWDYFFYLLGNGFGEFGESSLSGLIWFVLILSPLLVLVLKRPIRIESNVWLWASLSAMMFAALLTITIGRAGFGRGSALSSRYVEFSAIFIPIAVGLWFHVLEKNKIAQRLVLGLIFLAVAFGHRSSWSYTATYQAVAEARKQGIECLREQIRDKQPKVCPVIYPWPVYDRLGVAQDLQISFNSVFRAEWSLPENGLNQEVMR